MDDQKVQRSLAECACRWYEYEDMNCAEAILRGANEYYGLGISSHDMLVASGFGGGLCIGSVCGALSGAVMAVGRMFTVQRAHESETLASVVAEFLGRFESSHGSILCEVLKETYHNDCTGCLETVRLASVLLEDLIASRRGELAPARQRVCS